MRALTLCVLLALSAFLTGCQTAHPFVTPDSTWTTHVGQLKYSNRHRTFIGEVVVQRRGEREFQLDFLKGGSIPMISIREDETAARAEGLLAGGRWQGSPSETPPKLSPWFTLRQVFAHPGSSRAGAPVSWLGEAKGRGSQIESLSAQFPREGQRFLFQFNR